MQKNLILFLLLIFYFSPGWAVLSLPSGMSSGEQLLMLQTLGFGTSFRPINNPYPLGGYSGLEVAVAAQTIPTAEVSYYGNRADQLSTLTYPELCIGKGIFDDVDLFFNFIPYDQTSGVGIYSGAGRWTFFQATFVPASFSVLVHAGNSNFQNKIITQTAGGDLITGVDVDPFSFYFGLGFIHGQGQFSSTLTSDLLAANQVATSFHTVMGLNISISDMFLAFEIDSYSKIMLGLKIGARL